MWFEIAGKNGEELSKFYNSTFGWDISPETNGILMCDPSIGQGIKAHILPTTDEMSFQNHVIIYISVDDLSDAIAGGKSWW